jgi:membrane dipeptidase
MFLAASGAAALGACLPRAAMAAEAWPPYAQTLAIDASSGFGRLLDDDDGVLDPTDIADAQASGLSGMLLTLVPNASRFRFAGDALESTVQAIARWDRELVAHPDRLLAVRSGADLQRAHRERKVGLVYGFQETSPLGDDLDRVDLFHALWRARDPAHPQSAQPGW